MQPSLTSVIEASARRPRPNFSPDVVMDTLKNGRGEIHVVRDDLLPGGTKQRACGPLLEQLSRQGFSEFVYASPFCGFAQIALAYTCSKLGFSCTIFTERDRSRQDCKEPHAFTKLAEKFGARIELCDSLEYAEQRAENFASRAANRHKIPLGFSCAEFTSVFEVALSIQWDVIRLKLGKSPRRIWLPVGSGTLAGVFAQVLPDETEINCVNVHVLPDGDRRIRALNENPRFKLFSAPEVFADHALKQPTIPSNTHYDAKLWQFISAHGQNGDLWWNVAR